MIFLFVEKHVLAQKQVESNEMMGTQLRAGTSQNGAPPDTHQKIRHLRLLELRTEFSFRTQTKYEGALCTQGTICSVCTQRQKHFFCQTQPNGLFFHSCHVNYTVSACSHIQDTAFPRCQEHPGRNVAAVMPPASLLCK